MGENYVPNRNIEVPRSIREIFRDNRKFISKDDFDPETIRKQLTPSEDLIVYPLGGISCPTGRIVVGDPIAFLVKDFTDSHSPVLGRSIAPGKYPLLVSIFRSKTFGLKYCLAKMQISEKEAVRYEPARPDNAKLAGCPVDAGTLSILDEKTFGEYQNFVKQWDSEHPDGNIYDEYFRAIYEESAKKFPDLQREAGDFIDWTIPETSSKMYFFTSGFGDGLYTPFWGVDADGEVCELIIPMANAEDLRKADEDFAQMEKYLPEANLCLTSLMVFQKQMIGYLHRNTPQHGPKDSGWTMYEGTESEEFISQEGNAAVVDIRTLCQISPQLLTILDAPYGTAWVRNETGDYEQIHDEPDEKLTGIDSTSDAENANSAERDPEAAIPVADEGTEYIPDDDPIYKDLDQWHDDDEYEKILTKVEEIPFERRSNKLWFRKISALNNLKRFDDARREIDLLIRRCKTPQDQGKIFYMLGYIYDNTDCEFKAIECYRAALEFDPSREGTDELVSDSLSYAKKDMARAKEELGTFFDSMNKALAAETDLKVIDKPAIYTYFAVVSSSFMSTPFGIHLYPGDAYATCDENAKNKIRETLKERSNLTDLRSLQEYFGNHRNKQKIEDALKYMRGEIDISLEELNARSRTLLDATVLFLENMKEYIPEAHVEAWDYCDMLGLARLMYAADLLSREEMDDTYRFVFDECTKLFSSWEEYTRSVVLGAFYHMMVNESKYNIRSARRFAITAGGLCKHTFLNIAWPGGEEA
ncbi:MAG: DUF2185 domain-containing protein [Clostridiales bacterium]|nr:DUF2185 domain-containing protein [Clostridiales bacterium]